VIFAPAIYSIGSTASADDRDATVAEAARAVVEFLRERMPLGCSYLYRKRDGSRYFFRNSLPEFR
jgi:hypothetical protein